MIPKRVLSVLKSIAVFFPILTGAALTGLGTFKLGEANLVSIKQWQTPHGLMAFSSVQLETAVINVALDLDLGDVEGNIVPAGVEFGFNWDWMKYGSEYNIPKEVVVGVQFPFKITNHENFQVILKEDPMEHIMPVIDKKVIVTEEQGTFSSIFYVRFNPLQEYIWQHYSLGINFDLEGAIRQESFSVFTISLPVVLGLEPDQIDYPFEQCSGAHYLHFSNSLELTIEMGFPWDLELKQIFPSSDMVKAQIMQSPRSIVIEPRPYSGNISGKDIQMIMVKFEVSSLSEKRDRLLFDSGLYMGLGVGLLFTGIHEAFKLAGELRTKKTK